MNNNDLDTQPSDDLTINKQDNTAKAQNTESPAVVDATVVQPSQINNQNSQPHSSNNFVNETSKPKRIRLFISIIAFAAIVLIACAAWYIHHRSVSAKDSAAAITIANEKISPASCTTAHSLIKQPLDGDECYIAKFKVGSETIHYVIVKQSAAYQQKQASQCSLDCGGSIPITRSDYIVRASGRVQFALSDWTESAEPDIDWLTGCGDGEYDTLNSRSGQAAFVQDNGDIGLYVIAKDVNFSDQYGDKCIVSFNLTQDMTNDLTASTGLNINQLKVHYELQPISSCQQQSGSRVYECYQDQAVMRNNLSMCSMTVDPTVLGYGDSSCIADLAYRRQDPSLCTMIQTSGDATPSVDIKNCQTQSEQLIDVLKQKLIVD
jgi:hypothetical protein